ncbi:MAG TPA: CHRD domain-containing protein [Candidatus Tectomicrobia bacterium]
MLAPFHLSIAMGLLLTLSLSACQMVTPSVTPAGPGVSLNEVGFTAFEVGYEGPQSIPGGLTRIVLANRGEKPHDLLLFRLDDGKTLQDVVADFQAAAAAGIEATPPAWVKLYGGIAGVKPGERRSYVVDLAPGNYGMLSFGEFLKERTGVPDLAQGMMTTLTVTAHSGPTATVSAPDVVVEMLDYNFVLSAPIAAGEQVIQVTNSGDELHEFFIYRMNPGAGLSDFMTFFDGGAAASGALPGEFFGGMMLLDRGFSATFALDFEPGVYILVCFHPSTAHEGQSHLVLGMVQEITVETLAATTDDSSTDDSSTVDGSDDIHTLAITLDGSSKGPSGPPTAQDADGSGTAILSFDAAKGEICWELTVTDIAPAFASHIHKNYGAQMFSLSPPTQGAASGCGSASRKFITTVLENPEEYFVIVHNNEFPTSALSGRLAQ